MIRSNLFMIPVLAVLAIAMSGCGRGDTIYGGDASGTRIKSDVAIDLLIDDGRILPRGFFDQSVNRAVVDIYRDESNIPYLELRLSAGTNTVGGFNGNDIGNRALVGISLYDTTLVSNLPGVTFDAKSDALLADVLLIVDLDCTGTQVPRLLKAAGSDLVANSMALSGGFRRYYADTTLPIWKTNINVTDPSSPFFGQAGAEPGTAGCAATSAAPCTDNPDYGKAAARNNPRLLRVALKVTF